MINTIPYVEIVERIRILAREKAANEAFIRGIVNDVATREIPREYDWSFLKSSSAISCLAEVTTGVVTISTQNTGCWFSSGLTVESSHTGRKIKFSGNPNVYDFTFAKADSGAISPPLSGEANIGSGGYTMFKDTFALAPDFDRFPVNGGLFYYSAGQPTPIPEKVDDDWYANYISSPNVEPDMCRVIQPDTAGNVQVQVNPPPKDPIVIPYEYIKEVKPMAFSTGGTVITTSNSTVITGTGTYFTSMNTGDYFRINENGIAQDSDWYRIDTITSDTNLTLSRTYRADTHGAARTDYIISSAPPFPFKLQDAIIAGSMLRLLLDQNDKNFIFYNAQLSKIMTETKSLYKSRMAKDDVELIAEDSEYRR